MKYLILVVCLPVVTLAQSGEEIWRNIQTQYQSLSNYVDQGDYENTIYGDMTSVISYTYFVAIDSTGNVNHVFAGSEPGSPEYRYQRHAGTEEGVFERNLKVPESEPRTLEMACASLHAVGGSILMMASELMFPELFNESRSPYDSIVVLRDTLVVAQKCKRIALHSSYYQTQEMIDEIERSKDSIILQSRIPGELKPLQSIPKRNPGLIRFVTEYYISDTSDLIIHRVSYMIEEGRITSRSVLKMDPRVDAVDFERYLTFELNHRE